MSTVTRETSQRFRCRRPAAATCFLPLAAWLACLLALVLKLAGIA